MSAKLSILAKELGKELFIFDTFSGLPAGEDFISKKDIPGKWLKGQFCGTKDEVKRNLEKYGEPDVCHLVEGRFEDTLVDYDIEPSFIFIDVDLVASMQTCIKHFWPRLKGPRFYSHEASIKNYASALLDRDWWNKELLQNPPSHVGVGTGFSDAGALCYLLKRACI
jgi:hypothetical protein